MKKKKKYTRPRMWIAYSDIPCETPIASWNDGTGGGNMPVIPHDHDFEDGSEIPGKQRWGCHWDLWEDEDNEFSSGI